MGTFASGSIKGRFAPAGMLEQIAAAWAANRHAERDDSTGDARGTE
jgi:hypothetical protein